MGNRRSGSLPGILICMAVLLLAKPPPAFAADCAVDRSSLDAEVRQRVEAVLAEVTDIEMPAPGAGIVAVLDGRTIVCSVFGLADLEHGVEITHDSRFEMASVSKQFTALAILMLARDGKLGLDDPVRDHLDWLPDFGHEIRIHHLVHHSSGLKELFAQLVLTGRSYLDAFWSTSARSLLQRQRSLNHEPGAQYSYTNSGYFLLAQIVEQVAEQSLPEFLRQRLFEPLDMRDAAVRASPTQILQRRVRSYRLRRGEFSPLPSNSGVVGPAYLHLSVRDMAIWAAQFGDRQSRVAPLLKGMLATRRLNDDRPNRYAFGVELGNYRKLASVTHAGGWLGFSSYLQYLPEQKLTIMVASNNQEISAHDVAQDLTDAILGLDDPEPGGAAAEIEIEQEALESFAGLYETPQGDYKEMLLRGGRLGFLALPRQAFVPLIPVGPARFRVDGAPAEQVEFIRDDEGRVSHYLVHNADLPVLRRQRVARVEADQDYLEQFAGRYFSDELETLYTIRADDGGLVASSIAFGDIRLNAAAKDGFTGVFWFPTIRFQRDAEQSITAFDVTLNRVRHARFRKIEW